jgi:hypothetical protein
VQKLKEKKRQSRNKLPLQRSDSDRESTARRQAETSIALTESFDREIEAIILSTCLCKIFLQNLAKTSNSRLETSISSLPRITMEIRNEKREVAALFEKARQLQ